MVLRALGAHLRTKNTLKRRLHRNSNEDGTSDADDARRDLGNGAKQWNGTIGFFHPFWYDILSTYSH